MQVSQCCSRYPESNHHRVSISVNCQICQTNPSIQPFRVRIVLKHTFQRIRMDAPLLKGGATARSGFGILTRASIRLGLGTGGDESSHVRRTSLVCLSHTSLLQPMLPETEPERCAKLCIVSSRHPRRRSVDVRKWSNEQCNGMHRCQ